MKNFIQDFAKGLFNTGGNYKQTPASNAGKGIRMFSKRHPAGMILSALGTVGTPMVLNRLDELDEDIANYEQFWINKQGHTGVPKIEDYNSEDEFTEDFKLYWSTRPLDMEYR